MPIKRYKQTIKILLTKLFGQYCCAHSSQILERSDENWVRLIDFKKGSQTAGRTDGQRTDRHLISSADYMSSGAKTMRHSIVFTSHGEEILLWPFRIIISLETPVRQIRQIILDCMRCHGPLSCQSYYIRYKHIPWVKSMICNGLTLQCLVLWINHLPPPPPPPPPTHTHTHTHTPPPPSPLC